MDLHDPSWTEQGKMDACNGCEHEYSDPDSECNACKEYGRALAKRAADRRETTNYGLLADGICNPACHGIGQEENCTQCRAFTPSETGWKLVHTTPIECMMDDSGVYTVINRIEEHDAHKGHIGIRVSVRCDIMSTDDTPLVSFQGSANDVRKHVISWLSTEFRLGSRILSNEHASYIGWELHRAETDPNYVQD